MSNPIDPEERLVLQATIADLEAQLKNSKGGAGYKRGKNSGNYRTPLELRDAVVRLLGGLPAIDLACNAANQFGEIGLRQEEGVDSLKENWCNLIPLGEYGWLNFPFGNARPWVKKAALCSDPNSEESDGEPCRLAVLGPAAVGSNWYRNHVHHRAMVLILSGKRVPFDSENPKWGYPKDLALMLFGFGYSGFDVWEWSK